MNAGKVIQISVAGGEEGWGVLYALTDEGQIFCLDTTSMKKEGSWILVDSPDFSKNVKLRDDQEKDSA